MNITDLYTAGIKLKLSKFGEGVAIFSHKPHYSVVNFEWRQTGMFDAWESSVR